MRYVKVTVLAIILFLGFAFVNDIYMNELWNFDGAYFRVSKYDYFENDTERTEFITLLMNSADKYELGIFSVQMSLLDNYSFRLDYYGNEKARECINEIFDISPGNYSSMRSETTEVVFHDFSELYQYENRYVSSISFIGDNEVIDDFYNTINLKYDISYPKVIGGSDKDAVYFVWSIICVVFFILSIFEVIYRKKEVTLRISFGENVWKIIFRSILIEIATDFTMFFVVHKAAFMLMSGEFMTKSVLIIFVMGVIASSLLFFDYAIYDMKKILANVKQSEFFLLISYVAKIAITALSIFIISTNIELVRSNYVAADSESIISQYPEYSYIKVRDLIPSSEDDFYVRDEKYQNIFKGIFSEYYEKANPIICSVALVDDFHNVNYVVANNNAGDIVKTFAADLNIDSTAKIIYFLPDFLEFKFVKNEAEECLDCLTKEGSKLSYDVIYYPTGKSFTCIERDATYGLRTMDNPIIIWLREDSKYLDISLFNNTIFNLSEEDYKNIIEEYSVDKNGFEMSMTSISKAYEIKQNIFKRTVAFCSSLSAFLVILQIVLLISVNTLEYQLNAVLLALKKTFGYGIIRKNLRQIIAGAGIDMILGFNLYVICKIFKLLNSNLCIQIGLIFAAIDLAVIIGNIVLSEKRSTIKTLKGGCL